MKNLQINVEEITPELAAAWVEKNLKNVLIENDGLPIEDPVSIGDVRGEFVGAAWTERTIALVNDQHRLEACIRSGKPITSVVVRGVDRLAFLSIDTGQSRTTAQILAIKGKRILRS